ncbi:MAG TPA: CRISPR-associated endonuclease Cas3'', partial [Candidatus Wirthbacteria bacterium]|nr:CRISPR-associated endonuclease Cas3'' [Candidatus Wirthbacteria bacterium]
MNTHPDILAKSEQYGKVTLYEHLAQVALVAEKIALEINLDTQIAKHGALLHDIGKTHPLFQMSLKETTNTRSKSLIKSFYADIHDFHPRHELSSLCFLSLFPEKEWPQLIDMVVAHHKSIHNDKRKRGILDLT